MTLDDSTARGVIIGYEVTATTTFSGEGGESALEPGIYTLRRTATGWQIYEAPEGQTLGVEPDITAPAAITDLTAAGGEEQVTLSWSEVTDAQGAVHYRCRAFLTASGSTGVAWIDTDDTEVTLPLDPGSYTAEAYAYSQGGSSAVDSTSFVVSAPSGWNTILSDSFTGADGSLVGHVPDLTPDGDPWALGPAWNRNNGDPIHIAGNKITQQAATTSPGCNLEIPSTAKGGVGMGVDYTLTQQTDSSLPGITLALGPAVKIRNDGGTATISADNPSVGGMTLEGQTTGHPLTGRFSYRTQGTALSIMVNGVEVCTATMAANWNAATEVSLLLGSSKNALYDNLTVEVLTS